MKSDSDKEFEELDELHIIILCSIDRLIDDGHLGQVEQHIDSS